MQQAEVGNDLARRQLGDGQCRGKLRRVGSRRWTDDQEEGQAAKQACATHENLLEAGGREIAFCYCQMWRAGLPVEKPFLLCVSRGESRESKSKKSIVVCGARLLFSQAAGGTLIFSPTRPPARSLSHVFPRFFLPWPRFAPLLPQALLARPGWDGHEPTS